jgi:uncharacterized membrane protein YraQ (UPF0718 family)|tara:strand:- start:19 stop:471 length:453 start_codon:yes stop_codon:yes gene_type:complete
MNIPNLPTDNIYKFFALTGLFIVIFSIITSEIKLTDNQTDLDIYGAQATELEYEVQRLNSRLEKDPHNQVYNSKELVDELKFKNFKLSNTNELIGKKLDRFKRTFHWLLFGVIIGSIISFLGFIYWYNRVQRFLDYKLKLECELKKETSE